MDQHDQMSSCRRADEALEAGRPTTEKVQGIFARIAPGYDVVNILASLGIDRLWRRTTVRMANVGAADRVLDLCAGTGDLTLSMARLGGPAEVRSTDFVPEMLEIGKKKAAAFRGRTCIDFDVVDAQSIPYEDASFDIATVGFGVRNLPDRAANFREVLRVLRPGGRYLILEFTRPPSAIVRTLYYWYLGHVVPLLGGLVSGDRRSYQYLNDSILQFPDQETLAAELRAAGFSDVRYSNLTFGIVAVHVSTK